MAIVDDVDGSMVIVSGSVMSLSGGSSLFVLIFPVVTNFFEIFAKLMIEYFIKIACDLRDIPTQCVLYDTHRAPVNRREVLKIVCVLTILPKFHKIYKINRITSQK